MPPIERIVTRGFAHFALGFWITFIVCGALWLVFLHRGILQIKHSRGFSWALKEYLSPVVYIAFWGGLANTLVDLDHISIFFGSTNGRLLHSPLLIIALAGSAIIGIKLGIIYGRGYTILPGEVLNNLIFFGVSISVASHVIEDYWLNWF